MNNKELSFAYAIARMSGYNQTVDCFKEELAKVYKETLDELNSKQEKLAKVEATKNPFKC